MWKERARDIWIDINDETGEGCKFSFDQRSLKVVLFNVITNALKFQENGRIFIIVEYLIQNDSANTMLEITVVDQGIGIAASEVDQVFDLYWKSKSADHQRRNRSG